MTSGVRMNRPGEDNEKKIRQKMVFQPEPLCLFHFPEEVSFPPQVSRTYVNTLPKIEPKIKLSRRKRLKEGANRRQQIGEQKLRDQIKAEEDLWLKKRSEARVLRRKMKEPVRHLKSYLLTSVNYEKAPKKDVVLPSLFEVLETVKDAWPPPPKRNIYFNRHEALRSTLTRDKMLLTRGKMKEDVYLQFPSPLINRRFSMPEELMRKYFIMKEKTSEESETVKTMDEITSSSTTTTSTVEETTRRRPPRIEQPVAGKLESGNSVSRVSEPEAIVTVSDKKQRAQQQSGTTLNQPRRVTQTEYYSQGKELLKVKEASVKSSHLDACTCTGDEVNLTTTTTTTLSPKEETDESPTTESMVSSSPVQLPKQESPSDLLSSESDYIQCTCRELTSSKETSTDIFHSGKSTLSQTVSEKSVSTQDSTISVHSVSTRGSTVTDNSNTTTPDADKTSAKEESTTTSGNTPRTPLNNLNRKNRRRDGYHYEEHGKSCPKYLEVKHSRNEEHTRQCPIHSKLSKEPAEGRKSCAINTDITIGSYYVEPGFEEQEVEPIDTFEPLQEEDEETGEVYTWAKLSHDELYMMQQLRHQKLMESQLEKALNDDSETCDTMTLEYDETDNLEQSIMIPRYSALPRSLSMLVNMSSPENSVQNSDSDNLSLADSLEDQPTTHVHRLYFDTKKESKPVRGDVNVVEEKRPRIRVPKGKAFFVSIKDPFGEDELLEGIEKIPEPPEKIKKQINERHLSISRHSPEHCERKTANKQRKTRNVKKEDVEKGEKNKKTQVKKEHTDKGIKKNASKEQKTTSKKHDSEEGKQAESIEGQQRKRGKTIDCGKVKNITKKMEDNKEKEKKRFSSIIPAPTSGSSNSSPESGGDNSSRVVETTQILEITHTDKGVSLQEHQQAVKQPSSNTPEAVEHLNRTHLTIPALVPEPPYRPAVNRQVFQTRRSPVPKYRHRFEVIPEEKSSSLSSAEEKPTEKGDLLPKFTTTGTNPLPVKEETIQFETYNLNDMPNLIMAQVEDKQLKTLPYLKGSEDQKIILFSSKPQNSNSSKGRDALIAMNREDFNRLAKGWMNFYKLRENAEASDLESRISKENNKRETSDKSKESGKAVIKGCSETKQSNVADDKKNNNTNNLNKADGQAPTEKVGTRTRHIDMDENIRFHSSNTILRTVKTISPSSSTRTTTKRSSLPDLNLPTERKAEGPKPKSSSNTLPSVIKRTEYSDEDSDSDSTDYLEPPSPRVPPLPLEDFPSDATLSSSESEIDDVRPHTTANTMKKYEFKKWGGTNRGRLKKETARTKKNSGWSVTVAGTVELSRSAPDLEMRLSFPVNGGPPIVCQSDSGFAEDSNYSKLSEPAQESVNGSSRKEVSLHSGNSKQKWTVTVQNPNQGNAQHNPKSKPSKNLNNHLFPDVEAQRNRNTKKVLKKSLRKVITRKLYAIWPRIQQVVQDEFYADDFRFMNECSDDLDDDCLLTVRGTAVPLEKKEKPLTMTERDVTRRYTSRDRNSHRGTIPQANASNHLALNLIGSPQNENIVKVDK